MLPKKYAYGLYGYKRGTRAKPRFLGFIPAGNKRAALSVARKHKLAKNLVITDAKPYSELSKARQFQFNFHNYAEEVGGRAI